MLRLSAIYLLLVLQVLEIIFTLLTLNVVWAPAAPAPLEPAPLEPAAPPVLGWLVLEDGLVLVDGLVLDAPEEVLPAPAPLGLVEEAAPLASEPVIRTSCPTWSLSLEVSPASW